MRGNRRFSPSPQPSSFQGEGGSDLLRWYDAHRRKLPWREHPSPYRTWISEIMLQQTQVATALPYYRRFLKRFPNIRTLAAAREPEVMRHWAGLGYYSRARNLHRAAREIVQERAGRFPDSWDEVLALPGIGRYTAGAILSIAFDKPYPVLDGNVARVLSRLFAVHGNVKSGSVQQKLWTLAEKILDRGRPGDWNQALMELGARVCVPETPRCGECPLAGRCVARRKGLQDRLPDTGAKRAPIELRWTCLWIEKDGKVLLWKRSDSERLLSGHWSLPEARHLEEEGQGEGVSIRHTITHHKIIVKIRRAAAPSGRLSNEARWTPWFQLKRYLVSSLWLKAAQKIDPRLFKLNR